MKLDESHVLNQGVIRYLKKSQETRPLPGAITTPDEHPDPYWNSGNHPEIVERIWDYFGSMFSNDSKVMVYGTPALVHPESGIVFALAYGTQYAICIPKELMLEAQRVGCRIEQKWTGGKHTNLESDFGYGWVFGCWAEEEKKWLSCKYEELSGSP